MKSYLNRLLLLISSISCLLACSGDNLDSIVLFTNIAGAFTMDANEENQLLPSDFVQVEASATADNSKPLLDTFNLAQRNVAAILPETIELVAIDPAANWRFLRTVRIYIYNSDGSDSLLLARLDTISTNADEVIALNPNNESISPYLFGGEFQFKTFFEIRDTVNSNYNFRLNGVNRVTGGI